MYLVAILFSTVFLLQTSIITSQTITKYIRGSLADSWNFNFTFFTTDLDGAILYLVDYERNNLLVLVSKNDKNDAKNITIRYNKESRETDMKQLCGCYPCEEKMMNVFIKSSNGVIEMNCNKFGHATLRKVDIVGRVNSNIPTFIRVKMDLKGPNYVFTSTSLDKVGCLESLYRNSERIYFEDQYSKFRNACPRSCPIGDCHEGKCHALNPIGPMCDCSTTALSGPYCNNSMVPYNPDIMNSYNRIEASHDLYFKLTWKQKYLDKTYCLLEFVTEQWRITLTINRNFILYGEVVLSKIDQIRVNYLDVNFTKDGVTLKVNNKPTAAKPALLGKFLLNIGFSEKQESCETFEGTYDFYYNSSQIQKVQIITTETHPTIEARSTTSEFRIDIKIIILATGSSLLVTIVFSGILVFVICVRRLRERKEILTENVYDSGIRKRNARNNADCLSVYPYNYVALEYDRLNPNRFTANNAHTMGMALPELPPRNSQS